MDSQYVEIIFTTYGDVWRADVGRSIPGTPPTGFGRSKQEALGELLMAMQFETDDDTPTDWFSSTGISLKFID